MSGFPFDDDEQAADRFDEEFELQREDLGAPPCRSCGCTEDAPCAGGCWWIEPNLCSTCANLDPDVPVGLQIPPYGRRLLPRRVA